MMTRPALLLSSVVVALALPAAAAAATSKPAVAPAGAASRAADPLAGMTLEQKVGQLFLINVVGKEAPVEASEKVLREVPVGGIILFSYNLRGGPAKVAKLTSALQEIARGAHGKVPYLIAVDQEGGRVQRLKKGFSKLPAPRVMGQLSESQLEQLGHAIGRQLLAVGVNMNLAPVVEASAGASDVIADRGFAPSAKAAAPLAAAFITGTQRAGVVATAKHFPGNAGSDVDPHKGMPQLSLSREQIEARLLPPFKFAIEAQVDAVMLSHVEVPALDKEHPVALSAAVVGGLLREQLGYQGLVCSDDLLMKAVTEKVDPAEAAVLAVAAGTDFLMVSNPAEVPRLHQAVVAAVNDGRLPAERVDAAARRVLEAKLRRDLWASADRLRAGKALRGLGKARREADKLLAPLLQAEPVATP